MKTYDVSESRFIRVEKYTNSDYSGWRLSLVDHEDNEIVITPDGRKSNLIEEAKAISLASTLQMNVTTEK